MTNNTFLPARFGKLVVRNLKSNKKMWMQSILVLAGFPLFILLLKISNLVTNPSLVFRSSFLEFTIIVAFISAPFSLFFNYNHPKKGLREVMLPASIAEKYAAMQFACIVLAPLSVFVIFGAMDSLLALIFPKIYGGFAVAQLFKSGLEFDTFMLFVLMQQTVFFFNLLFVKHKVLKTFGVFMLGMILFTALLAIIMSIIAYRMPSEVNIDFGDTGLFDFSQTEHTIVVVQIFKIILVLVLPIALMIGSYFLMKNKRY